MTDRSSKIILIVIAVGIWGILLRSLWSVPQPRYQLHDYNNNIFLLDNQTGQVSSELVSPNSSTGQFGRNTQ